MQLKVQTHNVSETDHVLRNVFERYHLASEIREIDREDEEDPMGRIVYHLTISPRMSTDQLSEEIFSADPNKLPMMVRIALTERLCRTGRLLGRGCAPKEIAK